ncbi:Zinc/iron permease [Mycena floridula]|nr:Zinc/iron permease [Mycena floridula]
MLVLLGACILLGLSAYGIGILPLSFVTSKEHLRSLSNLGTGFLLGTGLGIIIPEGVESLAGASSELPTKRIALSLLCGFTFMLIVEQLASPHAHSFSGDEPIALHSAKPVPPSAASVEFDAELGGLEQEQSFSPTSPISNLDDLEEPRVSSLAPHSLTFGLVIHALADGLALGVSFFPNSDKGSSNLSVIVFLAIIIHKAPTALALTTQLLASSLPRADCKKHLLAFSASTPLAAIASYLLLAFFGVRNEEEWIGTALLLSGGTFLYVSSNLLAHDSEGGSNLMRVVLIVIGIFVPFLLSSLLGHGH